MDDEDELSGRIAELPGERHGWIVITSESGQEYLAHPKTVDVQLRIGDRVTFVSDGPQHPDDLPFAADIRRHD